MLQEARAETGKETNHKSVTKLGFEPRQSQVTALLLLFFQSTVCCPCYPRHYVLYDHSAVCIIVPHQGDQEGLLDQGLSATGSKYLSLFFPWFPLSLLMELPVKCRITIIMIFNNFMVTGSWNLQLLISVYFPFSVYFRFLFS